MRNRNIGILALCVAAAPTATLADAGTPLLMAGMMHLVFGNALIGVLEGLLLARVFELRKGRTIGILVLANYVSSWAGALLLQDARLRELPLTLENAWPFFWAMVVITYLVTFVLEFPFVALAFRGGPHWFRKCIRGSLMIQTVSYALLFGWYALASGTSLYTSTRIVRLAEMPLPADVLLYFLSSEDGDVYSMTLVPPEKRKVFDLKSTDLNDHLFVRTSSSDSNRWDLAVRLVTEDEHHLHCVTVKTAFASCVALGGQAEQRCPPEEEPSGFVFGVVPKLGSATNSPWAFENERRFIRGWWGTQTTAMVKIDLSFTTPFAAWLMSNATLLPGDKVLFQLGNDQICVFDPAGKRIALVAKGRGPVAVIPEDADAARGQR